jgi:thiol:disulfide interchange protein/DsbC/DsbD-like thiol-disulfide interchange protein
VRYIYTLLLLVAAILFTPVSAQPARENHIVAQLVSAVATPTPGSSTDIAIRMVPEPEWHGYWVNGGDAGFGMQIEWDLPRGVRIGALQYPVPETLIIGGLMNHVYERPYALITQLTVDASVPLGTRLPIRGDARWLACTDEVCVPEQGTFILDLVVGAGGTPDPRFSQWRADLPPMLDQPARFSQVGDLVRIAIPLPQSVALPDPHLFLETPRINQPGGEQRFARSGDELIVEMPAGSDAASARRIAGLLRLGGTRGLAFTAMPGAISPGSEDIAVVPAASEGGATDTSTTAASEGGATDASTTAEPATGFDVFLFLTAFAGAIVGGLILNIMPCVFPILSLKTLALARAGGDEQQVRREGLAYTMGAVLTCLALGTVLLFLRAGGEALGWAFQLQRPESVILLIVLMGAITANLAGLFEFSAGSLSFGRASTAHEEDNPTKAAFATGALAAFIATPCTGPFLGAALGATLTLPAWAALPIFGGLGLGLALPFLALALIPALRTRLPRPGPWMEAIRRWLALPMALTVLALVWLLSRQVGINGWAIGGGLLILITILAWWAGQRQRRGDHASLPVFLMAATIVPAALLLPPVDARAPATASESILNARPWSAAAVTAARANGPVFVYFTADWCLTCKVNEGAAIDRTETAAAFRAGNVSTFIADWTNADPAITAELASHNRNSVPLYLWYPADGSEPEILPQVLTPGMLAERAQSGTQSR